MARDGLRMLDPDTVPMLASAIAWMDGKAASTSNTEDDYNYHNPLAAAYWLLKLPGVPVSRNERNHLGRVLRKVDKEQRRPHTNPNIVYQA